MNTNKIDFTSQSPSNYELVAFSEGSVITTTNNHSNDSLFVPSIVHVPVLEDFTNNFDLRNFTFDLNHVDFDVLHKETWRIAVIIIYVIVIAIGLTGNVLVVYIIVKNKHLHSVTNIFIVNLAVSDIALCLFNLPFQLHYQLTDNWLFGSVLCHVIMPTFAVPVYVSSMSILVIAIDRYILLLHPFKKRMTIRCAVILLGFITVLAAGPAVPLIVFTKVYALHDPLLNIRQVYCGEDWPSVALRRAYSALVFLLQFFIPLVVTTLLYSRIYLMLKRRSFKKAQTNRRQRTNKVLGIIVLLFGLCWLPWNIFIMLAEFNYDMVRGKYFKLIDLLLKIFAMSSACVNPVLYGWLNDNFRKELDNMIGHLGKRDSESVPTKEGHTLLEPSRSVCPTSAQFIERFTTDIC